MKLAQVTFKVYHNGTLDHADILDSAHYWLESMEMHLDDDWPDAAVSLPESEVVVDTAPFDVE